METDPTDMAISAGRHPTLAELRQSSHPDIVQHLTSCSKCRSAIIGDTGNGAGASKPRDVEPETSEPIPLDLPKGLVSETAFRWPAQAMARGGMAQIFSGEDRRLARAVILKAPREGDD